MSKGSTKGKKWTPDEVLKKIVNPIYAGLGPFPPIIDDKLWVAAATRAVKDVGAERFFKLMLRELRTALEQTPPR